MTRHVPAARPDKSATRGAPPPPLSPRPKTIYAIYAGAGASSGSGGSGGAAASGSGPQGGSGCGLSFGGAAGRSSASAAASQSASRFDGVTQRFVCARSLTNLSANQCNTLPVVPKLLPLHVFEKLAAVLP